MCLALPADVLNDENGLTYTQDVLSNAGGCAASGGSASGIPEITVAGAGIAYYGAIFGLGNAINTNGIVHVINPAG